MDPSRLLKLANSDYAVLIPHAEDQEQTLFFQSELSTTNWAELGRSVTVSDASKSGMLSSNDMLHTANSLAQHSVGTGTNLTTGNQHTWPEKESSSQATKPATDNMTRWLKQAESEITSQNNPKTYQASQSQGQAVYGYSRKIELPVNMSPVRSNPSNKLTHSRMENVTPKNKVVPVMLHRSNLQQMSSLQTSNLADTVPSELPVDLRNIILLPKSQSDDQSGFSILPKNQFDNQSFAMTGSSTIPEVKQYTVSPVYKSKLEKAIAQNQNIANSQSTVSSNNAVTKTTKGTLKRLLNSHMDTEMVNVRNTSLYLDEKQNTTKTNHLSHEQLKQSSENRNDNFVVRSLLDSNTHKQMEIGANFRQRYNPEKRQTNLFVDDYYNKTMPAKLLQLSEQHEVPPSGQSLYQSSEYDHASHLQQSVAMDIEYREESHMDTYPSHHLTSQQSYKHENELNPEFPIHSSTSNDIVYKEMSPMSPGIADQSQAIMNLTPVPPSQLQTSLIPSSQSESQNNINHILTTSSQLQEFETELAPAKVTSSVTLELERAYLEEDMTLVLTEKEYEDTSLANHILDNLWLSREEGCCCDAVLYVEGEEVKLHKIVLAAASPVVNKKIQKSSDPVLKLVLPSDMCTENVNLLVRYIYKGNVKLTVDNVQQIYRLSGMFGLEELGKFCYDFCKLSKMGYLIISSPYQEDFEQLNKTPQYRKSDHSNLKQSPKPSSEHQKTPLGNLKLPPDSMKSLSENTKSPSENAKTPKDTSDASTETPIHILVEPQNTCPSADKPFNPVVTKKDSKNSDKKQLDIDWMTSDPSQSHIPIRKRGRGRKSLTNAVTNSGDAADVSPNKSQTINTDTCTPQDKNVDEITQTEITEQLKDTEKAHQHEMLVHGTNKKYEVRNKKSVAKKQSADITIYIEDPVTNLGVGGERENVFPSDKSVKSGIFGLQESEVVRHPVTCLPDPLATGKFDETELLKLVPLNDEPVVDKNVETLPVLKESPTKTMVTRLRGKNKNMSVLEAALSKKARTNDTSGETQVKSPKKLKGKTKKSPTVSSKASKVKMINEALLNAGFGKNSDQTSTKDQIKDGENNTKNTIRPTVEENQQKSDNQLQKSSHKVGDFDKDLLESANTQQKENPKSIKSKTRKSSRSESIIAAESGTAQTSPEKMVPTKASVEVTNNLDDSTEDATTPPKKSRLRKSTLEQESPLQDKVYMRPPPKKRTKEIREMMKNEEETEEERANLKFEQLMNYADEKYKEHMESQILKEALTKPLEPETSPTPKPKPKKTRRHVITSNSALQRVVNEIEEAGMHLNADEDRHYRCTLCDNRFHFPKRAVTHLMHTHEIDVDQTIDYIAVEHRNPVNKTCDICGYETKEVNVYYIHYHKYFRHGVPLPKGWQPFTCDLCKKEFFTKFQLREHKLIHFYDNPFVCEHCGSGFKSRTCLNSHVFHKHGTVKKHHCKECKKSFKTATALKIHVRMHSGEKPFGCPDTDCTYRSTTRGNMRLHLANKHKFGADKTKEMMKRLPTAVDLVDVEDSGLADGGYQPTENPLMEVLVENLEEGREYLSGKGRSEEMDTSFDTLVEAAATEAASSYIAANNNDILIECQNITPGNNIITGAQSVEDDFDENQRDIQRADMDSGLNIVDVGLEGHNIPRHVQLLIQSAADAAHDQQVLDMPSDDQEHMLNEYHPNSNQQPAENIAVYELSRASMESFENEGNSSRLILTQKPRIIDPQSREARMLVKEALQGNEAKLLLKPDSLASHIHKSLMKPASSADGHLTSTPGYQESRNLGQGTINSDSSHHLLKALTQQHQYMPDTSGSMFDNEQHHNPASMPRTGLSHQNIDASRHQNLDLSHHQNLEAADHPNINQGQGHLQIYHHVSSAPPAYNSASHGIISVPMSDISVTQSGMIITSIGQGQLQSQGQTIRGHQVQTNPEYQQQGQSYEIVVTESSGNVQYNNDGTIYPGYYQENYQPIENY